MNIKKISNVTCSLYFECVDFLEVHIFLRIDICIIVPKWLDLCKGFYLIPKGGKSVSYFHQVL